MNKRDFILPSLLMATFLFSNAGIAGTNAYWWKAKLSFMTKTSPQQFLIAKIKLNDVFRYVLQGESDILEIPMDSIKSFYLVHRSEQTKERFTDKHHPRNFQELTVIDNRYYIKSFEKEDGTIIEPYEADHSFYGSQLTRFIYDTSERSQFKKDYLDHIELLEKLERLTNSIMNRLEKIPDLKQSSLIDKYKKKPEDYYDTRPKLMNGFRGGIGFNVFPANDQFFKTSSVFEFGYELEFFLEKPDLSFEILLGARSIMCSSPGAITNSSQKPYITYFTSPLIAPVMVKYNVWVDEYMDLFAGLGAGMLFDGKLRLKGMGGSFGLGVSLRISNKPGRNNNHLSIQVIFDTPIFPSDWKGLTSTLSVSYMAGH
jgi:hypothetical protein